MAATQQLLLPDPQPLVERLGREFFRTLPDCPGVYLMRDASEAVLYVGKAKSLRKRLCSYRIANPDRMPRRHLRLLRAVERIECRPCADEASALAYEAELLRTLKPRFNRAGTWSGMPRFVAWRMADDALELTVTSIPEKEWRVYGPLGAGAIALRSVLARLFWRVLRPEGGVSGMPAGWFEGRLPQVAVIPSQVAGMAGESAALLEVLLGASASLAAWAQGRIASEQHPFERAAFVEDVEFIARAFRAR